MSSANKLSMVVHVVIGGVRACVCVCERESVICAHLDIHIQRMGIVGFFSIQNI